MERNEGQGRGKQNSQSHGSRKWQNPQNSRNGNPSKRSYHNQKCEGQKGNCAHTASGGEKEDAGGSAHGTVVNSLHSTTNQDKMAVLKNFKAVPKQKPNSTVRSLIDDGAQRTWIKKATAKSLKLPVVRRELLAVATAFSSQPYTPKLYDIVTVSLRTKDNRFLEMEAVVSPDDKLVSDMPAIRFDPTKEYPHLKGIKFADDYPRDSTEVELLIGNDYANHIQTGRRMIGGIDEPCALETIFGWILSGNIPQESAHVVSTNFTQVTKL